MIQVENLREWQTKVAWRDLQHVEQDLILSRILCDLYGSPMLAEKLAFRGGTAINKLLYPKPLRYSEDLDLVQLHPEPVGETIGAIRKVLSWLGKINHIPAHHSHHLFFKFMPEHNPANVQKIKVEINTRTHKHLYGVQQYPLRLDNPWHQAEVDVTSFAPEEIFGSKFHALLQRRKNRDLFDIHEGLSQLSLDIEKIIASAVHYMMMEGKIITRALAEQRMLEKLGPNLADDIGPLLPIGTRYHHDDAIIAFNNVWRKLISKLEGDPWKLSEETIAKLREKREPNLIR